MDDDPLPTYLLTLVTERSAPLYGGMTARRATMTDSVGFGVFAGVYGAFVGRFVLDVVWVIDWVSYEGCDWKDCNFICAA